MASLYEESLRKLSILLNMVGLPTCIPQVAITKHERLSKHPLTLY